MLCHILRRERARRGDRRETLGGYLVFDNRQTAVNLFLLLRQSRSGRGDSRTDQETAAGGIHRFRTLFGRVGCGFAQGHMGIGNRMAAAFIYTVAARDAARIVHGVVGGIDAGGFATALAEVATVAFVGIDMHAEPRETRQETEHRTHGQMVLQ